MSNSSRTLGDREGYPAEVDLRLVPSLGHPTSAQLVPSLTPPISPLTQLRTVSSLAPSLSPPTAQLGNLTPSLGTTPPPTPSYVSYTSPPLPAPIPLVEHTPRSASSRPQRSDASGNIAYASRSTSQSDPRSGHISPSSGAIQTPNEFWGVFLHGLSLSTQVSLTANSSTESLLDIADSSGKSADVSGAVVFNEKWLLAKSPAAAAPQHQPSATVGDDLCAVFTMLRCEGRTMRVSPGELCQAKLPGHVVEVCLRITYKSVRPFFSFFPRVVCAGSLDVLPPYHEPSAGTASVPAFGAPEQAFTPFRLGAQSDMVPPSGGPRLWREGWLRLAYPGYGASASGAMMAPPGEIEGQLVVMMGGTMGLPQTTTTLKYHFCCQGVATQ